MLYLTTHPLILFTIHNSDVEDSAMDVNHGTYFNKEIEFEEQMLYYVYWKISCSNYFRYFLLSRSKRIESELDCMEDYYSARKIVFRGPQYELKL